MLRQGDDEKEFKKKLQNVPKPINDTRASPEMEDYLRRLNNGEIAEKDKKQREEDARIISENNSQYKLFCPKCRRAGNLKQSNIPNTWACGYCGLVTNSPLRMSESMQTREVRK